MLYFATLAAAVLTLVTTFLVMFFYFRYSKYNDSRLLNTIIALIFTDFMIALLVLVWDILHRNFPKIDNKICSVFLQFPIYFFLAGYGWTVIVAFRFLSVSRGISYKSLSSEENQPSTWLNRFHQFSSVSSWSQATIHFVVWGGSFILILPMIILNSIGGQSNISNVVYTPVSPNGAYCFFESDTWTGRLTNNFCFQLPLLLTIAANTRAFILGLRALRNSPHSVIAREMNRVGKYLFVLLLIWIPNFLVNLYQEFYGSEHSKYEIIIELMVLLTSLQGFLNAVVYCWGHKSFRKYIRAKFAPLTSFSSASFSTSIMSYSEYPSPLLPTLMEVATTPEGRGGSAAIDNDLLEGNDEDDDPSLSSYSSSSYHPSTATATTTTTGTATTTVPISRTTGGSDADLRISSRRQQQSSGDRILRFSPTISVKYFDKEKKPPGRPEGECLRVRGSSAGSESGDGNRPPSLNHLLVDDV